MSYFSSVHSVISYSNHQLTLRTKSCFIRQQILIHKSDWHVDIMSGAQCLDLIELFLKMMHLKQIVSVNPSSVNKLFCKREKEGSRFLCWVCFPFTFICLLLRMNKSNVKVWKNPNMHSGGLVLFYAVNTDTRVKCWIRDNIRNRWTKYYLYSILIYIVIRYQLLLLECHVWTCLSSLFVKNIDCFKINNILFESFAHFMMLYCKALSFIGVSSSCKINVNAFF